VLKAEDCNDTVPVLMKNNPPKGGRTKKEIMRNLMKDGTQDDAFLVHRLAEGDWYALK
jgi:hypothetical protein